MTPDYKSQSRGYSRDMSSVAIAKRLDKVAELYELWKFLRTGKRRARQRRETGRSSPDRQDQGVRVQGERRLEIYP